MKKNAYIIVLDNGLEYDSHWSNPAAVVLSEKEARDICDELNENLSRLKVIYDENKHHRKALYLYEHSGPSEDEVVATLYARLMEIYNLILTKDKTSWASLYDICISSRRSEYHYESLPLLSINGDE